MTFENAQKRILQIVGTRYISMGYERTHYERRPAESRHVKQACWVYVDPGMRVDGATWEEVIKGVEAELEARGMTDKVPVSVDDGPASEVKPPSDE